MLNVHILRRLLTLFLATIFVILGINIIVKNQKVVKAFGPLKITYSNTPMFFDNNLFPGKSISQSIIIENTDNTVHSIGIKTDNLLAQDISLANIIDITITKDGIPIYGRDSSTGKKNLADFSADDVVNLNRLAAGERGVYDFVLQMEEAAGDEYQGQLVKFDLLTGTDTRRFMTLPTVQKRLTIQKFPTLVPFPTIAPF